MQSEAIRATILKVHVMQDLPCKEVLHRSCAASPVRHLMTVFKSKRVTNYWNMTVWTTETVICDIPGADLV